MNNQARQVLLGLVCLLLVSCGNSNDSFIGGNSNSNIGTAPVTFRFLTAQGTLPPDLNEVRFQVRDELGHVLIDTEKPLAPSITLDIPISGIGCTLFYGSGEFEQFSGLVPLTLFGNQPQDILAPLGDPLILPLPDPGNVSITPANSTIGVNTDLSFIVTSQGLDITNRGTFLSTNDAVFAFLDQNTNEGRGLQAGSSDITFNTFQTVQDLVVAPGFSGASHVKVLDSTSAPDGTISQFFAYEPEFTGGTSLALADINNDGFPDIITGSGPGGGPHVKVFDGNTRESLGSFFAFDPRFTGGVTVAAGDVNGDGRSDIIVGASNGAPQVRVFDGRLDPSNEATPPVINDFFAFDESFTGGVRVASGDINNDGRDDIITGSGTGGGPHVRVFDGRNTSELASFFAYDSGFRSGVFVASGDVNGDGTSDIITAPGPGAAPQVKVFSGRDSSELNSFFAFEPTFIGGVQVGALDADDDGNADIVVGGGQGADEVKVFDGETSSLVLEFVPFPGFDGGVTIGSIPLSRQPIVSQTQVTVENDSPSGPRLNIISSPLQGAPFLQLNPPLVVEVLDGQGQRVNQPTNVTVSLAPSLSSAFLEGTLVETSVNGLATFGGISISENGTFRLDVSANGFSTATTGEIVIMGR